MDYRGQHQAPGKDGAPLYNLAIVYPADVYSANGPQYYGVGDGSDRAAWSIVRAAKGKPNLKVRIYRAVPKTPSTQEKIAVLEKDRAEIMRKGKLPAARQAFYGSSNASKTYETILEALERLRAMPIEKETKLAINPGDWVAINKRYAVNHGESVHGRGKYRVLSKTVLAKNLYTDGNSIEEWGYVP